MGTVKCGEIFISDSIKLTFTCFLCYEAFEDLESYENHLIYDDDHIEELFKNNIKTDIKFINAGKDFSFEFGSADANMDIKGEVVEESAKSRDDDSMDEDKTYDSTTEVTYQANINELELKCIEVATENHEVDNSQNSHIINNNENEECEAGNFQCETCLANFNYRNQYDIHLKRNRCGICPICNLSFSRIHPHLERRHRKIHPKYAKEGHMYYDRKLGKLIIKTPKVKSPDLPNKRQLKSKNGEPGDVTKEGDTSEISGSVDTQEESFEEKGVELPREKSEKNKNSNNNPNNQNQSKLNKNEDVEIEAGNFQCQICLAHFIFSDEYNIHVKRNRCGICPICNLSFSRIHPHLERRHREIHPKYAKEGQLFYDKRVRKLVIKTSNDVSGDSDDCETNITYSVIPNLITETNPTNDDLKCTYCYQVFGIQSEFEEHEKRATCGKCSECKKIFLDIWRHIFTSHKELFASAENSKLKYDRFLGEFVEDDSDEYFECEQCEKRFKNAEFVKQHSVEHTQSRYKYKCSTCGKACDRKFRYIRHMKTHLEKSFKCNFCNHAYRDEQDLSKHMISTHTGERNFKCRHDGCESYFVTDKSRITHEKSLHRNSVLMKYFCNICKLTFKSVGLLKKHINQTHFGQTTIPSNNDLEQESISFERILYPCGNCNKSFFTERNLKCHLKYCNYRKIGALTPDAVPTFDCKVCARKYTNKKSLLEHLRLKHPDVKIISAE